MNGKKTFFTAAVMLLLLVLGAGCGTEAGRTTISRGSADVIGTITAVQAGGEGISGTFDLEVRKADAAPEQYVITIGRDAPVYRHAGEELGELDEVGFGSLQTGQKVEVWFAGPVAESFPMQAEAEFVVIAGVPED